MSPITLRALRPLLALFAVLVVVPGLAACGGDGDEMSKAEIEKIVNAQPDTSGVASGAQSASDLAKEQIAKDADQAAADEARKRRRELEQIKEEQKREAQKVLDGDVEDTQEDLEKRRFQARIAGVCEGAASRIGKVSKAAEKVGKSDDPRTALKVAQDYSEALGDFMTALESVEVPPGEAELYRRWLGTIDDLSNTIRLQIVSLADASESAKLQTRTAKLTSRFLDQSARLGISCLSLAA